MLYLVWNDKNAFFTSTDQKRGINFGLVRMYVTPYRISGIIFTLDLVTSYTEKLVVFRWIQIVLLLYPICFYFATKESSWFLFLMIIKSILLTSRYLDVHCFSITFLKSYNPYFEGMVNHKNCNWIKLILKIPMSPFWIYIYLFLMVLFPAKFYDKRDDFDFTIVNFPFLDGDVPRFLSYGLYISQLYKISKSV